MARYGVLGDIHGNKEALVAVLDALERRGVDRFLCLGDVVGYNADPDECAALLRERDAACIAGNHDLIGTGRLGFLRCSNKARYSLRHTRRRLGRDTAAWLRELPGSRMIAGHIALVHGGVRDVQQYMTAPQHILKNAAFLQEDFPGAQVCFFGHSHEQKVWEIDSDNVRDLSAGEKTNLRKDLTYFINPGSVDAQRKRGNRLAECAIFDAGRSEVQFLQVAYDHGATEAKAARAGYRIGPVTDWAYSLRTRFFAELRNIGF